MNFFTFFSFVLVLMSFGKSVICGMESATSIVKLSWKQGWMGWNSSRWVIMTFPFLIDDYVLLYCHYFSYLFFLYDFLIRKNIVVLKAKSLYTLQKKRKSSNIADVTVKWLESLTNLSLFIIWKIQSFSFFLMLSLFFLPQFLYSLF